MDANESSSTDKQIEGWHHNAGSTNEPDDSLGTGTEGSAEEPASLRASTDGPDQDPDDIVDDEQPEGWHNIGLAIPPATDTGTDEPRSAAS